MSLGQPLKFKSVEELQAKIDGYFAWADENEKPYTITGLALYLDTCRQTLLNYQEKDGYMDTVKRAKLRVENYNEEALHTRTSPTGPIFALKNFGWSDRMAFEGGDESKPIRHEVKHDIKSVAKEIAGILD